MKYGRGPVANREVAWPSSTILPMVEVAMRVVSPMTLPRMSAFLVGDQQSAPGEVVSRLLLTCTRCRLVCEILICFDEL